MPDDRTKVTRTLRYEVLRRDGFACRYCGAKAPDVKITVDHVVPTALGGENKPENLVAACAECNSGKAASNPEAEIVANVADDALRWAAALDRAAQIQREAAEVAGAFVREFRQKWDDWTDSANQKIPLRAGWEDSIARFYELGIDSETLAVAIRKAMTKRGITGEFGEFNYMCGVVWRIYDERQALARGLVEGAE